LGKKQWEGFVCSLKQRTKPSELVLNLCQNTRAINHPDRSSAIHKLWAYSSAAWFRSHKSQKYLQYPILNPCWKQ